MAIKKGDRLILKDQGMRIPVVAASDESEGTVQIKQKGVFSTTSIHNLEVDTTTTVTADKHTEAYVDELLKRAEDEIKRLRASGDPKAKLDGAKKLAKGGLVIPIARDNFPVPDELVDDFESTLPKWPKT